MRSDSAPLTPADSGRLRAAFGAVPTGVMVATACTPNGRLIGMTVNSFVSLSLDPPLVLFCVDRTSAAIAEWLTVPGFAINVLGQSQRHIARQFAHRHGDKWALVSNTIGRHGAPVIIGNAARFECTTEQRVDGGDHVIFVGRVEAFCEDPAIRPLGFLRGRLCAFAFEDKDAFTPAFTQWPLALHY